MTKLMKIAPAILFWYFMVMTSHGIVTTQGPFVDHAQCDSWRKLVDNNISYSMYTSFTTACWEVQKLPLGQ